MREWDKHESLTSVFKGMRAESHTALPPVSTMKLSPLLSSNMIAKRKIPDHAVNRTPAIQSLTRHFTDLTVRLITRSVTKIHFSQHRLLNSRREQVLTINSLLHTNM
jgi:hypothetical protein